MKKSLNEGTNSNMVFLEYDNLDSWKVLVGVWKTIPRNPRLLGPRGWDWSEFMGPGPVVQVSTKAGFFLVQPEKNSRSSKLKNLETQEKNSKLNPKFPFSGIFR